MDFLECGTTLSQRNSQIYIDFSIPNVALRSWNGAQSLGQNLNLDPKCIKYTIPGGSVISSACCLIFLGRVGECRVETYRTVSS